jgi:hypothetical protein
LFRRLIEDFIRRLDETYLFKNTQPIAGGDCERAIWENDCALFDVAVFEN